MGELELLLFACVDDVLFDLVFEILLLSELDNTLLPQILSLLECDLVEPGVLLRLLIVSDPLHLVRDRVLMGVSSRVTNLVVHVVEISVLASLEGDD